MDRKVIRLQVKLERLNKSIGIAAWGYRVYSDHDDNTSVYSDFGTEELAYKYLDELHKLHPDAVVVPKNEMY